MSVPVDATELVAWRELCRRLEALGARLGDPTAGFPSSPVDRAEGVTHLAREVVCFLGWADRADPLRPAFHRQNDPWTPWGGPNADNVYRHARVDARYRYRIRGRLHGCEDFILAVRAGFMHMETWGTLHQVTASDLGLGPGDAFELLLGGDDPDAIPLPEGAAMVSIREYYFDWQPREPATFTIECLDDPGPGSRLAGGDVAARLGEAIEQAERSVVYWNDYLRDRRAERDPNSFAAPLQLAKGLAEARYAFCFYELAPGEALVVDTDVPDARYWSFQLYTLGWFELVDPLERISSLNHTQVVVGDDGRVQVVVGATDTGAANWLDTGDRAAGLLTFRWFWPTGEGAPSPATRVVPVTELGPPVVSPAARAEQLRRRREHLAWRFRT